MQYSYRHQQLATAQKIEGEAELCAGLVLMGFTVM
jgi:hypothetical protein